jgi:hypothetical protein
MIERHPLSKASTPRVLLAVISVAVASSLTLGGCSLLPKIPSFPVNGQSGGSSSTDTGSDSQNPDSSSSDDLATDPSLNHEVPANFPSEIPLPNLNVVFSLDLSTGWSVVFESSDPVSDFAGIDAAFASGGWETLQTVTNDTGAFGVYENDTYQVQVSGVGTEAGYDTPVIAYTVVIRG